MIVVFREPGSQKVAMLPVMCTVNHYSHHAVGGPLEATISIRGNAQDIVDTALRLRYRVEIYTSANRLVWWGFMFASETRVGERQVNVSLGRVSNRVAVAYSELDPGQETSSERKTTTWVQDLASISRYGKKERLISYSDTTQEVAEAVRDIALTKYRLPRREVSSGISEGGSLSGLLTCKGWFNTLGWELYTQDAGLEAHSDLGTGTQDVGDTSTEEMAQSFQISSTVAWYTEKGSVRARAEGSPADNMVVSIHDDSSGVPGTQKTSGTIPGTSFDTDQLQWMVADMASRVLLNPSTTYWLKIARSGSQDASNYYVVDVDEGLGYTKGVLKLYNGSSWVSRSTDADMNFSVAGVRETSVQMAEMLDDAAQFITGYTIKDASGVYSNPFRDGNNVTLFYLRELLAGGTSAGIRYLARVDQYRHLWIYEEPPAVAAYRVDEYDRWYNAAGAPVEKSQCPVGEWYSVDLLPGTLQSVDLLDAGVYFMERSTYRPKNDRLMVDPPDAEETVEEVEFI